MFNIISIAIVLQWFEEQLSTLNITFKNTIEQRKEETYKRLEKLNERISNMDMYFEDEKCRILKYIDDRGEELSKLLYKFKVTTTITTILYYNMEYCTILYCIVMTYIYFVLCNSCIFSVINYIL